MKAQDLIDDVAFELSDKISPRRWPEPQLLSFLNAGLRRLAHIRPDEFSVTQTIPLQVNQVVQALPENSVKLFALTRDMGRDGTKPGPDIRLIDRSGLTDFFPEWSAVGTDGPIEEYIWDELRPREFMVNPFPRQERFVEAKFATEPELISDPESPLPVPSVYAEPLKAWMLYSANSTHTESAASRQEALAFYDIFYRELGVNMGQRRRRQREAEE